MQCAVDRQLPVIEIQIRPLKAQHFPLTHTGGDGKYVQRFKSVTTDGLHKLSRFLLRKEPNFRELARSTPLGSSHPGGGRIRGDVLPVHGEL